MRADYPIAGVALVLLALDAMGFGGLWLMRERARRDVGRLEESYGDSDSGTRPGHVDPLARAAAREHTGGMRTLTRRLAPHSRAAWLVFATVAVAIVAVAIPVVLLNGGGRPAVVATAFTWLVAVVVLGAFLDAILVPGNPDVRRRAGHDAGWTGLGASLGAGGGFDGGGSGDGGGSC